MAGYLDDMDLPPSDDDDSDDDSALGGAFAGLCSAPDTLTYKRCDVDRCGGDAWKVTYAYSFLGAPETTSTLTVRLPGVDDAARVRDAFAPAGLVVLCWHWMATPAGRVESAAVPLSSGRRTFWREFYRDAFAEFAAVNGLDPSVCDIEVDAGEAAEDARPPTETSGRKRVLCGLGGGKDSLVARFLATAQPAVETCDWIYVDDGGSEFDHSKRLQEVVATSGGDCVVARHDFGYEALDARRSVGAKPCGHPWAALVAFDGAAVAHLLGYDAFVVGNERSAADGNGIFLNGREVNHQFDKALDWETRFAAQFRVAYFSPLQRLWDLQIAGIFALEPALRPYWSLFRSCNDSGDCDVWCGRCDKCAFVFLVLRAFRAAADVAEIFDGKDLFDDEALLPNFSALAGLDGAPKPFECVGTFDEAGLALELARLRVGLEGVPYALAALPPARDPRADLLDDLWDAPVSPAWWDERVLEDLPAFAEFRALRGRLQQRCEKCST